MNTNILPFLRRLIVTTTLLCTLAFAHAQDAGSEAAATALLKKFLAAGTDRAALTKELRPTSDDYAKVFTADFARKLEASQKPLWDSAPVIGPKDGQTEVTVAKATTEDFQKGTAGEGISRRLREDRRQAASRRDAVPVQICEGGRDDRHGVRRPRLRERPLAHLSETLARGGIAPDGKHTPP